MMFDSQNSQTTMLVGGRTTRAALLTSHISSRTERWRSRHADDQVIPYFHLISAELSARLHPPDRPNPLTDWCSSPEFCRFTGRNDFDSTPPTAA